MRQRAFVTNREGAITAKFKWDTCRTERGTAVQPLANQIDDIADMRSAVAESDIPLLARIRAAAYFAQRFPSQSFERVLNFETS